jgi:SAM-dependent methyltransferase
MTQMEDHAVRDAPVVRRYEHLVKTGVYSSTSVHGAPERDIFVDVLRPILAGLAGKPARVLDCGCGSGEWLEVVAGLARELGVSAAALHGFDVTPGMVEAARVRLDASGVTAALFEGDVLDPSSYRPDNLNDFDLVFTFDVVQQLPRSRQSHAVDLMLGAVRSGGTLAIFDHERHSGYGRRMGLKKWVTRHLRVPLVPSYYTASAYPSLDRIAGRLDALPGVSAHVISLSTSTKRALVATRTE